MNNPCNEIYIDIEFTPHTPLEFINVSFEISSPKFTTITGATLVDDEPWYQITCTADVARWLRTQNPDQWFELQAYPVMARALFDIAEPLYLIMVMKWK